VRGGLDRIGATSPALRGPGKSAFSSRNPPACALVGGGDCSYRLLPFRGGTKSLPIFHERIGQAREGEKATPTKHHLVVGRRGKF